MSSWIMVHKLQKLRKSQDALIPWDFRMGLLEKFLQRWKEIEWPHPESIPRELWSSWVVDPIPRVLESLRDEDPRFGSFPMGLMLVRLNGEFCLRKLGEILARNILAGNSCLFLVPPSQGFWLPAWESLCREDLGDFFSCQVATDEEARELAQHPSVQGVLVWGTESASEMETWKQKPHRHQLLIGEGIVSALSWEPAQDNIVKALWDLVLSMESRNPYAPHRLLVLEKHLPSWLDLLASHLLDRNLTSRADLISFRRQVEAEQGRVVAEAQGALLIRDLPQCSVLHQSALRLPVIVVNSVKYRHDFVKWVTNSAMAEAVWMWGSRDFAIKLMSQI
ncbi:MAG: hypothetical protein WCH11_05760, partial [Bdellovibrio sp.]